MRGDIEFFSNAQVRRKSGELLGMNTLELDPGNCMPQKAGESPISRLGEAGEITDVAEEFP